MDKLIEADLFLLKKICMRCSKSNSHNSKQCGNCKSKILRNRKKLKIK